MPCPECASSHARRNGKKKGKQNHICVNCRRPLIDQYEPPKGDSDAFKRACLKMSVNGTGFRALERVTGVHHPTVIDGVEQVGQRLPDAYAPETMPEVGALDALETFGGSQKTRSGCGQPSTTSALAF